MKLKPPVCLAELHPVTKLKAACHVWVSIKQTNNLKKEPIFYLMYRHRLMSSCISKLFILVNIKYCPHLEIKIYYVKTKISFYVGLSQLGTTKELS